MDVTPRIHSDAQVIQHYKTDHIKISGQRYETTVLVFPDKAIELDIKSVAALKQLPSEIEGIDFLIVGTGEKQAFLPKDMKQALREQNITAEAMTTASACSMYNVLMADGRRIAALLFL
ncbi:MAG: hypothetical protein CMH30_01885 [Micavibrio sp.]|nr:hypothetical protein [Micavibrio sp.]